MPRGANPVLRSTTTAMAAAIRRIHDVWLLFMAASFIQ
jgi:hypothetical protein